MRRRARSPALGQRRRRRGRAASGRAGSGRAPRAPPAPGARRRTSGARRRSAGRRPLVEPRRSRLGRLAYATSRSVAWRNRQRRRPPSDSRTRISASSSSTRSSSVGPYVGIDAPRARRGRTSSGRPTRGGRGAEPRGQRVEPGGDDRLHRRREARRASGGRARRLGQQHARGLDDEERVAPGAFGDLSASSSVIGHRPPAGPARPPPRSRAGPSAGAPH